MPTLAARPADRTKSETVVEIRAAVARISPLSLRRLREGLFRLQLQLIEDMISSGVDVPRCTAFSHVCRTLDAVDVLQMGQRQR